MGLSLKMEIKGEEQLKQLFQKAPFVFRGAIRHWLSSERKMFVGNKVTEGKFSKKLLRLKHSGTGPFKRGGTWEPKLVHAFKGYLSGDKAETMVMTMGIGSRRINKPFFRGIEKM